jgi:hypothetical protein
MTSEFSPRYREPSAAERMGRWLQNNTHHILSGVLLFGLSEGLHLTDIWDGDPFRAMVETAAGDDENFGWGGRALVDLSPEPGDNFLNWVGNTVLPEVQDSTGDGIADNTISFKDKDYSGLYIDKNDDGKVDATGKTVQEIADSSGNEVQTWTQYNGIKTYVPKP